MIHQNVRRIRLSTLLTALALLGAGALSALAQAPPRESRDEVLATMKRATTFMTGSSRTRVATSGTTFRICPGGGERWKPARR